MLEIALPPKIAKPSEVNRFTREVVARMGFEKTNKTAKSTTIFFIYYIVQLVEVVVYKQDYFCFKTSSIKNT